MTQPESTREPEEKNPWPEVLRCAVVGTERATPNLPDGGHLMAAVRALPEATAESRLLSTAAMASVFRRAGRPAEGPGSNGFGVATESVRAQAERDARPPLPARSLFYLRNLKAHDARSRLLAEWIRLAADSGFRPPPELLPEFLDLGARRSDLRIDLRRWLGPSGAWLASLSEDWKYAAGLTPGDETGGVSEEERLWTEGSPDQRIEALESCRRRAPAEARARIEDVWNDEHARFRARMVWACREGLSRDDEAFLERCLDDRSKDVRANAGQLLGRMVGSALQQRMIERVERFVRVEPRGKRPKSVSVELPESLDEAMVRDGVANAKYPKLGERASWLRKMVSSFAPSRAWDPEYAVRLVSIVQATEWSSVLIHGWLEATIALGDVEWAEAFLTAGWSERELWALASSSYVEKHGGSGVSKARTTSVLSHWAECLEPHTPWTGPLAKTFIASLAHCSGTDDSHSHNALARRLETGIDPGLLEFAEKKLRKLIGGGHRLSGLAEQLVEVLRFRRDLRGAFEADRASGS